MLIDIEHHLGAVERSVVSLEKDGAPARSVVLSRTYDTSIEDLWDAATNPERLPRWFAAVEGDLRSGGHFQVKGNAGGKIVQCDPPNTLSLTWEYGDEVSWVDVAFEAQGPSAARLTLTHTSKVTPFWEQYGPGATGVGWELGLLGLPLHLADHKADKIDEEAFAASDGGRAFSRGSSNAWGDAAIRNGEPEDQARAAAARTAAFFTGESESG
ncbi:MAG: SRPBCC domain-containing protein [Pseudomonadota bacterium]